MSVGVDADLKELAIACRKASQQIARLGSDEKNRLLHAIADLLVSETADILAANERDVSAAKARGLSDAMVDRLVLDPKRLKGIAAAVLEVAALPDPVGEVTRMWRRPNGIQVGKQRIPLGVIAMIYESRPNVTVDAAVLCLKAGNGIILRGGSEAFQSNSALARVIGMALEAQGLPAAAASLVPTTDREAMNQLLTLDEQIDLVIPRGGEGLIRFVNENSRIPVIKHYKGVCHLYVHEAADPDMAVKLMLNGKTSRPGVCNALETMLVDSSIANEFFKVAGPALKEHGVEVRGCPKTRDFIPWGKEATDEDYHAEFLAPILAVKVVDGYDDAVAHILEYGSDHTEVIVTRDYAASQRFIREVNASVVMVNASSRFSDGGQLGLGAEIGISTTRLHSYGPMGLTALTTEKFIVFGDGQIRE